MAGSVAAQTLYRSGGGDWDTITNDWGTASDGPYDTTIWDNTLPNSAVFEGTGGVLSLSEPITANSITFDAAGFTIQNGSLSFAGTTSTITANADGSITSAISGTTLLKAGDGDLTLGGGINLTDRLTLAAGTTTFTGSGDIVAGTASPLWVGSGSGSRAVLEMASTGLVSLGASQPSAQVRVGSGAGASGAAFHDSGDVRIGSSNGFSYLTIGQSGAYGYYRMNGGTLDVGSGNGRLGMNVGDGGGGIGVYEQAGGVATFNRYIVIGNGNLATRSEATLTGGTLNQTLAGNFFLVGDDGPGRMNLGTLAGGDALIATAARTKIGEAGITASGHLNLNSGTLRFTNSTGGINADTDGRTTVGRELALALNGATIQAAANNIKLIWGGNDAPLTTHLFNGGITIETQGFNSSIETPILAPAGNGIYIDSVFTATPGAQAGAGYIGVPQVAVSGGSGSGAQVRAVIDFTTGTISGFEVVRPGENYQVDDVLTFTLSGGGASQPADPYTHTLTADELEANGSATLAKTGSGTLTLTEPGSYGGTTMIEAGSLIVSNDSGSATGTSNVQVEFFGTLGGSGSVAGPVELEGFLSPGSGVGTLTIGGDLDVAGDAVYRCEIGAWDSSPTPGGSNDLVTADGGSFTATPASPWVIEILPNALSGFSESARSFTIASFANAPTGFDPDAVTIDDLAFTAATGAAGSWSAHLDGNNLQIIYAPSASSDAYATWIDGFFPGSSDPAEIGFDSDPDGDGIANGIEFVIGGDPKEGVDTGKLPRTEFTPTSLVVTFRRSADSAYLEPSIEWSTDLAGWTDAVDGVDGVSIISGADDPDGTPTVEVSIPRNAENKIFARLKVNQPE